MSCLYRNTHRTEIPVQDVFPVPGFFNIFVYEQIHNKLQCGSVCPGRQIFNIRRTLVIFLYSCRAVRSVRRIVLENIICCHVVCMSRSRPAQIFVRRQHRKTVCKTGIRLGRTHCGGLFSFNHPLNKKQPSSCEKITPIACKNE
mgnify:CR=1 FL=1